MFRKEKKLKFTILTIIIVSLLLSAEVVAAEKPDIGDVLQETGEEVQIEEEKSNIPEIAEEPLKEPLTNLDGRKVPVKRIKVKGNSVIGSDKLEELVNTEQFVDKKLSLAGMEEAASVITRYYRDKGYFVARAYIPQQEMEDATLTIAVIEGKYGEFQLFNSSPVKNFLVQGMLDAVKDENIISVNTIERAMLIINDTPGILVTRADVMPGEKVGTSNFTITTGPGDRYSGYLAGDNYGGKYTGKNRLSAGFNINSPFKIGDRISLRGLLTDERGIKNYRIGYSLPLSYTGLRGELAYSDTAYELGEEYADLEAVGNSRNLTLNLTYPVIRTRTENLEAFLNFARRDMVDSIKAVAERSEKEVNSLNTGLTHTENRQLYNWHNRRKIKIDLTFGQLEFVDPADKAADEAGAGTSGQYSKINVLLTEDIEFNSRWSLDSSLQYQHVLQEKNLDGSEDLSIGGPNGVRLYPSGEYSAENGYLFNLELFYNLPEYRKISSRFSIFYDRGRADMADRTPGFEPRTLQDIGLGYYVSYRDVFANIHWAYKIDNEDIQSEDDYDDRLLFQVGYLF